MKSIELTLKDNTEKEAEHTLNEIIQKNYISVILGAPGSGKSTILLKYEEENDSTQYLTVKRFLKLSINLKSETKIILLDGLDEYRSLDNIDKSFVMTDLGSKINDLLESNDLKVVISCREMDWYGEEDTLALKDEIRREVTLFYICPLNEMQIKQLSKLLLEKNSDSFIDRFSNTGFLSNPQMLKMISALFIENPEYAIKSKIDIYSDFIKKSREINRSYTRNNLYTLEPDEIQKYVGYIAFYYIFSEIDEMNENFLDDICSGEKGYPKDKLNSALHSKVFQNHSFLHRSIAEYSCSWFLYQNKMSTIEFERTKSLFVKNGKIPSELRGVYAWLCSITGNTDLIEIDPFYQAMHGDNSVFPIEHKKKIILAVKQYAEINPYFYNPYFNEKIEGFYHEALDDFLIHEYQKAIDLGNHYIYFLSVVITSASNLSSKMITFIQQSILSKELQVYYKIKIIKPLQTNEKILVNIKNKIFNNEIPDDDDSLKDIILSILYPHKISSTQIVQYLFKYNQERIGHCDYLFNTDYTKKFSLTNKILRISKETSQENHISIKKNLEYFIQDYLIETILNFEEKYTAKEIYDILKQITFYYGSYYGPTFKSYRFNIDDTLEENKDKLNKLTDELYSLYIDEIIDSERLYSDYHQFDSLYSYKIPENKYSILRGKLSINNDKDINFHLLTLMHNEKKENIEEIIVQATELGLNDRLSKWLEPPSPRDYETKRKKERKKREQEKLDEIQKNEDFFKNLSDEKIAADFGLLHNITNLIFIKDSTEYEWHMTKITFERLREILSSKLLEELIEPDLLTINSLAEYSPTVQRNIDRVYYVACQLNSEKQYKEISNDYYLGYLYICSKRIEESSNAIKGEFTTWIETKHTKFAIETLQNFILLVIEYHLSIKIMFIIEQIKKENEISVLKHIFRLFESNNENIENCLLKRLLQEYGFLIPFDELEKLQQNNQNFNTENRETIISLILFSNNDKDKIDITFATRLYNLIDPEFRNKTITDLNPSQRINFADLLFTAFSTEESIKFHDGFQSDKDTCASFLQRGLLDQLTLEELQKLSLLHNSESSIWKKRLLNKISEIEQKDADADKINLSVQNAKDFLLSGAITSRHDFYSDIKNKIYKLKTVIEANRDNEKTFFFDSDKKPRKEEYCRDLIVQRLKDKYGMDLQITREQYEGNNRVDINIKYRSKIRYEVQIECKKDNNPDLDEGIEQQLIDKYLSQDVQYGIYLVFCFSPRFDIKERTIQLFESIPDKFKNNIEVICLDLR